MTTLLRITNPANGDTLAELPTHDSAAINLAYRAARAAQPGWAARPYPERAAAITRFRDALVADRDALAAIMSEETGKPINQARNEIGGTVGRIDFFLQATAKRLEPELVHREPANALPGAGSMEEVITYDPLGVVVNISAWNYPYFVGSNVFIPALLTGSAVLYKPSEFATRTGLAIAERLHAAGVPEAVFAPIVGGGEVGARLLECAVDGVFFTGSYGTGRKVAAAAAEHLIPVQLELGGKDPAYVCDDVDPAGAAGGLADGAFYNNGQSCCAVERIYVHDAVYDAFVAAFEDTVRGFAIGDPSDENTYLGPVTRSAHVTLLEQHVADAVAKGAKILCGGKRIDRAGAWFEPTVLVNVTADMDVMREETFGPVIGIQRVASDEAAVALMNDTEYGLTAAVFTRDRGRAARLLGQLNTGTAYWNCCDRVSPRLPWSGRGHSGLGVTLSTAGVRAFLRPRAWHLRAP